MDFHPAWFAAPWQTVSAAAALCCLVLCARPALAALRQRPHAAGVLLCFFAVFWTLDAGLGGGRLGGISYHLLGITLGSLMLGAPAVLWLAALFMLAHTLPAAGTDGLSVLPLNLLALTLPALAAAETLKAAARRFLPPNLFLYIFVNGFFAAALGMAATGAAVVSLLALSGAFPADMLWRQAFLVFLLLGWGEAFLTGLFAAVFVAFRPQLLASFDDARYLSRRNRIWPSESQP